MKRYCFLIGAPKAGTSAIFHCFRMHRHVARTRPKETNMFSGEPLSRDSISAFNSVFIGHTDATVYLEASTQNSQYPLYPRNAENIRNAFPHARFLYVLRDPLRRIESHYNYFLQKGFCGLDTPLLSERFIVPSLYATQLDQYRAEFESGRVHLISYEHFKRDAAAVLRGICNFLELPEVPLDAGLEPVNRTRHYTLADRIQYGLKIAGLGRFSGLLVNRCTRKISPLSKVIPRAEVDDAMGPTLAHRLTHDIQRLEEDYGFDTSGWTYTREKLQLS